MMKGSQWGLSLSGGGDKKKKKLRTDPTEMTRTILHILSVPPHHPWFERPCGMWKIGNEVIVQSQFHHAQVPGRGINNNNYVLTKTHGSRL